MSPFERLLWLWGSFWFLFSEIWWLVLPLLLFGVFASLWLFYLYLLAFAKIPWGLLEIRIPKEIARTPKAMEQIFAAVAAIDPTRTFLEKWWKGKVIEWVSFEMVGVAHGVHFFVRVPVYYRNLVEAAVYAQYPEAEIVEISDDYTELLPQVIPNNTYDLFGVNFKLAKADAYPIRTYQYFEDPEEERRLDPLAAITEVMSRLKEGEMIWLQLLVQPTEKDWRKESDNIVNELVGEKKSAPKKNVVELLLDLLIEVIKAPFVPPEFGNTKAKEGTESQKNLMQFLTPVKKDIVQAIEEKASKIGFHVNLRFIYIDNRASFTRVNVSAVAGAFQQFNTKHMNALRLDKKTSTLVRGLFKKQRVFLRKRRIFENYKLRLFEKAGFILNIEELATLYHFPATVVEAPRLGRVEAKKGEPPSNLPIG